MYVISFDVRFVFEGPAVLFGLVFVLRKFKCKTKGKGGVLRKMSFDFFHQINNFVRVSPPFHH